MKHIKNENLDDIILNGDYYWNLTMRSNLQYMFCKDDLHEEQLFEEWEYRK